MSEALDATREVLAGQSAWLVGGAVRDRLMGRETRDVDVVVHGDPEAVARDLRRRTGGAAFPLSEEFGGWRVVARDHAWHVDVLPLHPDGLPADLGERDFTINAMAAAIDGDEVVDPHGGREDLAARRLRMVSPASFDADPLRTLRAVRLAAELGLEVEPETLRAAGERAPRLGEVAAERVFAELRRVLGAPRPVEAIRLADRIGVLAAILPELGRLKGVEQNVFHHLDVYEHTLEVLGAAAELEADPSALLGEHGPAVGEHMGDVLADELTRWQALRLAALLHDVAKPATRGRRPDGRVTFLGHDERGAGMAREILDRLRASQRLADYVAALTRHHLTVGFLVHERPLSPRAVHRFLSATEPNAIDVAVLTVADRLATRGRNAEMAIPAHLEVARALVGAALDRRAAGRLEPLVRGDDLARELGIAPGPGLGELLAQLEEDRFAGEIATREDAVRRARELLGNSLPPR